MLAFYSIERWLVFINSVLRVPEVCDNRNMALHLVGEMIDADSAYYGQQTGN